MPIGARCWNTSNPLAARAGDATHVHQLPAVHHRGLARRDRELGFGVWAIFFDTGKLLDLFGLGGVSSTIWVYNYSILLIILSCFYIPAAHDRLRYQANAWLLVVGRLVPADVLCRGIGWANMPEGFVRLGIGDATFGIIELILLIRLRRDAEAVSPVPA